jgi:polar amino acid transport system substrate-binding protein
LTTTCLPVPNVMRFFLVLFMLSIMPTTGALAQQADPSGLILRIGTKVAPPFAMKAADGAWEGISIDLLAAVADKLGVTYQLQETTLAGMIDDVAVGKLDASIAAMTMTAERERVIDFSYAFFRSGLGVAIAERRQPGLAAIWDALTSRAFLSVAGALAGVLFVVGALVWLFERKYNSAQFESDPKRGLFSGFWWAAVTMTTTGYGDKAPTTVGGRILAILWMFAALIVTSGFTAQLAATLTAKSIQNPLSSPTDLALVRVGNVADAASGAALQSYGVRPLVYTDVSAGLKAVADGEIDAFVHDEPILVWEVSQVPGVTLAPLRFAPQDYAIVLPPDSSRREAVNRALLEVLASDQWAAIQRRYLGDPR